MPILGTIASSYLQATTSFVSIETKTITGSSAASVEFTSIPNTYAILHIRYLAKTTNSGDTTASAVKIEFNNDTTSTNYWSVYQVTTGTPGSATAAYTNGPNYGTFIANGGAVSSDGFSGGLIEIIDYTSTNKFKTTRAATGYADANYRRNHQTSVTWRNSASAITSLKLTPYDGNLAIGSSFALYGIKGS